MLDRAFEYIPRKPEETVLYRMIEQRGLEDEADTLSNLYSRMAGAREYSAPSKLFSDCYRNTRTRRIVPTRVGSSRSTAPKFNA